MRRTRSATLMNQDDAIVDQEAASDKTIPMIGSMASSQISLLSSSSSRSARAKRHMLETQLQLIEEEEQLAIEAAAAAARLRKMKVTAQIKMAQLEEEDDKSSCASKYSIVSSVNGQNPHNSNNNIRQSCEQVNPCDPYIFDNIICKSSKEVPTLNHQSNIVCQSNDFIDYLTFPKLNIQKFNGDPTQFPTFYARVKQLLLDKPLPDEVKFTRLLQFLDGPAKCSVASLEGVSGALSIALEILKERFGNPYVIVSSIIDKITSVKVLNVNEAQRYQEYADELWCSFHVLKQMGQLSEVSLDHMRRIVRLLPVADQNKWREKSISNGHLKPAFEDLVKFIKTRAAVINNPIFGVTQRAKEQFKSHVIVQDPVFQRPSQKEGMCVCCNKHHSLSICKKFKSLSLQDRLEFVKKHRLCFNCLRLNHSVKDCYSKGRCQTDGCSGKHNTLLHDDKRIKPTDAENTYTILKNKMLATNQSCLQIMCVRVHQGNKFVDTLALVDTGSSTSFIESSLADQLGLSREETTVDIGTITGSVTITGARTSIHISSPCAKAEKLFVEKVLVMDDLNIGSSSLPTADIVSQYKYMDGVSFKSAHDNNVRLLIGTNVPRAFIPLECRSGRENSPIAVRTVLGWAIIGPMKRSDTKESWYESHRITACEGCLDHFLEQLHDPDNVPKVGKSSSQEDRLALSKMERETFFASGHYTVPMLWKSGCPKLYNNYSIAKKRLCFLRNRLKANPSQLNLYKECIDSYISKGFASPINHSDMSREKWYLPHHGVFNANKPNKIRVVFDAAADYINTSLNKQLMHGPDLTNSLVGVLLRFRQFPVVVTADIESMFHQVFVLPSDRTFLRFLWWPASLNDEPQEYCMNVHIFGASSSPSCVNFALRKTAEDNKSNFSTVIYETIMRNFYVDDLLVSTHTVEEAIIRINGCIEILQKGGFNLTKVSSNRMEVLLCVSSEKRSQSPTELIPNNGTINRALGVKWDNKSDNILFFPPKGCDCEVNTKRGVLSIIASLYDPLGYLSPITLMPKMLLQELWRNQAGWDEEMPEELLKMWLRWKGEINCIKKLNIPRCYSTSLSKACKVELHVFCDASTKGYGCVAYLKHVFPSNSEVAFLFGKSRTAPIKATTIPRLELCAATLAAQVGYMLSRELDITIDEKFYWTDSTTALAYIHNTKKRFHMFVSNRLAVIHENSETKEWRHCPGETNPADEASRGMMPQELTTSSRWFKGPKFLYQGSQHYPRKNSFAIVDDDPEVKTTTKVFNTKSEVTSTFNAFLNQTSCYMQMRRYVVYYLKFQKYLKKEDNINPNITPLDLESATQAIVRYVQKTEIREDYACLLARKLSRNSVLRSLNPFMEDGIIRVGGRLANAKCLSYSSRHPYILPKNHNVSIAIVNYFHKQLGHASLETTICNIREQFWIIGLRQMASHVIKRCLTCKRYNSKAVSQQMSPLPIHRLSPFEPVFSRVGIDYFGPMTIKCRRHKESRWGCIFTCLTTRAIHLELVEGPKEDEFLCALSRFVNRRGPIKVMYSDNAKIFVGVRNLLKKSACPSLRMSGVNWKLQVPRASHMSGAWERMIGLVRRHIDKIVGTQLLTDYQLRTLLTEIEFILNSRPLTKSSDDPNDMDPLTPNHFLFTKCNLETPSSIIEITKTTRIRKKWLQIQHLADCFWQRWQKEYLPLLTIRKKWYFKKKNIRTGDLVIIRDENQPRSKWLMARVLNVFNGNDGLIRSVELQTTQGKLTRPVTKLCVLEENAFEMENVK